MIEHVPEALSSKLFTLMKESKVYSVNATISREKRKAPEETWEVEVLKHLANIYFMDQLLLKRLGTFLYLYSPWTYVQEAYFSDKMKFY